MVRTSVPDREERRPDPDALRNDGIVCEDVGAAPRPLRDPCIGICCAKGEGEEGLKETLGLGCED